jgi:hypothetical protein
VPSLGWCDAADTLTGDARTRTLIALVVGVPSKELTRRCRPCSARQRRRKGGAGGGWRILAVVGEAEVERGVALLEDAHSATTPLPRRQLEPDTLRVSIGRRLDSFPSVSSAQLRMGRSYVCCRTHAVVSGLAVPAMQTRLID